MSSDSTVVDCVCDSSFISLQKKDQPMIRRIARSVTIAAVLCAASEYAHAAECIQARYRVAGKYADCEAKAASKEPIDEAAFLKCRQKYAQRWTKLGKHSGSGCSGARFVDNGDGTILDNLTQLIWEKKTTAVGSGTNPSDRHDVDNTYTWSAGGPDAAGTAYTDFLDDLNSSGFAGQHDWRLPTRFELHSLLATDAVPCGTAPCVVDPLFSSTQSNYYFTSSTTLDNPAGVWAVGFVSGESGGLSKVDGHYVRAVRAGH